MGLEDVVNAVDRVEGLLADGDRSRSGFAVVAAGGC